MLVGDKIARGQTPDEFPQDYGPSPLERVQTIKENRDEADGRVTARQRFARAARAVGSIDGRYEDGGRPGIVGSDFDWGGRGVSGKFCQRCH